MTKMHSLPSRAQFWLRHSLFCPIGYRQLLGVILENVFFAEDPVVVLFISRHTVCDPCMENSQVRGSEATLHVAFQLGLWNTRRRETLKSNYVPFQGGL